MLLLMGLSYQGLVPSPRFLGSYEVAADCHLSSSSLFWLLQSQMCAGCLCVCVWKAGQLTLA